MVIRISKFFTALLIIVERSKLFSDLYLAKFLDRRL